MEGKVGEKEIKEGKMRKIQGKRGAKRGGKREKIGRKMSGEKVDKKEGKKGVKEGNLSLVIFFLVDSE